MICGEVAKLTGKVRMYSTMKMAKTKLENVIGDTTMKMANAKGLKIKACFFEISYLVSYIYVLYASKLTHPNEQKRNKSTRLQDG